MYKITIFVLVGIIVGLLAGNFFPFYQVDSQSSAATDASYSSQQLVERMAALEETLAGEIERNNQLELMLANMNGDDIANPTAVSPARRTEFRPDMENRVTEILEDPEGFRTNMEQRFGNAFNRVQEFNSPEARISRYEQAGFPTDQAMRLVQLEEERVLDNLYQEWDARRQMALNNSSDRVTADDKIRNELGEEGYEKYLSARGMPTSVAVGSIMSESPAQMAGLQAGDEILRYNGERVYSVEDLNDATVQGELGEPVVMTIKRDDVEMQVSMDRGPLGIYSRPNLNPAGGRRVIREMIRGAQPVPAPLD